MMKSAVGIDEEQKYFVLTWDNFWAACHLKIVKKLAFSFRSALELSTYFFLEQDPTLRFESVVSNILLVMIQSESTNRGVKNRIFDVPYCFSCSTETENVVSHYLI